MNEENKLNQENLDFEKMNATLANPEFANWYYSQMVNGVNNNISIEDFVQIVQKYNLNKMD
ncbi:hypothetical protein [Romboutsia sp.]|uniref:hypothetical protein n=1 Tax=Romboutsia sp. TaxID=1965302 RepID=UPI003F328633